MISPAGNVVALDRYIGSVASKDAGSPMPTLRAEYVSTIGDCTAESFVADLRRTRRRFGKENLKVDGYHVIVSQTHEEADPRDEQAGHRQHQVVRELVRRRFPGHQAKLVTQRDNGHWGDSEGEPVWVPGKWHTHVIVANVSEREAVLELIAPDGSRSERRYRAGRAIDGAMKDIKQLRRGTDELVLERLGYDNAAYIDVCRKAGEGRGNRGTTRDMAARTDPNGPGYSSHDEVRVKLREARALAESWDDYVSRLGGNGVQVKVTGKSGVSYGWVGDDGVEHAASARSRRGKDGLGNDFTKANVEKQCTVNAAAIARGEVLEAPERAMVPASALVGDRPMPEYRTADGKPPWERDVDEYAVTVRESGGTFEEQARERIDLALIDDWVTDRDHLIAAAPDHGVEVTGRTTDEPLIALDTSDGRIAFAAGHLGDEYTGDQLDRRIRSKRRARNNDNGRGPRGTAGGDPERRPAADTRLDAGIRIQRVDSAGLAALSADNLRRAAEDVRRAAEQRAELDDDSGQHSDRGVERAEGQQPDGREDRRAGETGGDTRRGERGGQGRRDGGHGGPVEATSETPLRDAAVAGAARRDDQDGDRSRD